MAKVRVTIAKEDAILLADIVVTSENLSEFELAAEIEIAVRAGFSVEEDA